MKKYYIVFPGPVINVIPFINKLLNVTAKVWNNNIQVCQFESNLSSQEIEEKISGNDLALLTEKELSKWF